MSKTYPNGWYSVHIQNDPTPKMRVRYIHNNDPYIANPLEHPGITKLLNPIGHLTNYDQIVPIKYQKEYKSTGWHWIQFDHKPDEVFVRYLRNGRLYRSKKSTVSQDGNRKYVVLEKIKEPDLVCKDTEVVKDDDTTDEYEYEPGWYKATLSEGTPPFIRYIDSNGNTYTTDTTRDHFAATQLGHVIDYFKIVKLDW